MNARRVAGVWLSVVLAVSLAVSFAPLAPEARARVPVRHAHHSAAKHAPNGPPLSSTAAPGAEEGENTAGVPSAKGDQLVENGLGSPLCKGAISADLSSAAQSNCETSGFVGAPAPTNNYAFDVNINVGAFGLSKGGVSSVVQDMFIAPIWSGIEWVAHALVVMLEWGYTLELLGGSTMGVVARSLRQAQASFTEPWLTLVFAAASILALYNGLIRRRVTDTLGQGLAMLAMTAAGLWIIANPSGTVGAVGQWANQASIGTLGAVAQGSPANGPRTLADSMRALFGAAVEMPWCYLEFGNVRWCSDPALLDPRLRQAAVSLAAAKQAKLPCRRVGTSAGCDTSRNSTALATEHSQQLVREADTNGKLFLAFPANQVERNSVKQSSSLLHILCQAEDATKCAGPTAAQAEFRSDRGTFPRMIGVVLIAAGVLGMLMLFGLVALHLLIAALVSLFMLLLAPFAVLAPALGESGRAAFGGWLTRLLGALTSKLLFSFLLGTLITMQRILLALPLHGWWTQWLLMSACWWAVFLKRHQAIAFLQNGGRQPTPPERRPIARRIGGALESYGAVRHPVRWTRARINARIAASRPPADEQLRKHGHGEDKHEKEADGGQNRDMPANSTVSKSNDQSLRWRERDDAGESEHDTRQPREPDSGPSPEHGPGWSSEQQTLVSSERFGHEKGERPDHHTPESSELGPGQRSERQTGRTEHRNGLSPHQQQVGLSREQGAAQATLRTTAPADLDTRAIVLSKEAQLMRVREARRTALSHGDRRRATTLAVREQRVEGEVVQAQRSLESERPAATVRERTPSRPESRPESSHAGSQPASHLGFGHEHDAFALAGSGPLPNLAEPQIGSRRPRSRVMDDAREVAEGRKRQLGYGRPPGERPVP